MKPKKTKNRIIGNPFDVNNVDMILDTQLKEKRYLGKEKKNYVQAFSEEANEYCNSKMDCFQGRWVFEFFHSDVNVLYHTDTIPGNDGDLGFILPLDWEGNNHATIMYEWWSDRRVQYAGLNKLRYCDNNKIVSIDPEYVKSELIFEWSKDKALIFDCKQLHSARKFTTGWKEFIIGFVV